MQMTGQTGKKPRRPRNSGGMSIQGNIQAQNVGQYIDIQGSNVMYTISTAEREAVAEAVEMLRQELYAHDLPPEALAAAENDVNTLKKELSQAEKPDGEAIKKAGDGLLEKVPGLVGALTSLFASPVVGKVVEVAGKVAIEWVKMRFKK